VEIKQG
jgi:hypothetical protein